MVQFLPMRQGRGCCGAFWEILKVRGPRILLVGHQLPRLKGRLKLRWNSHARTLRGVCTIPRTLRKDREGRLGPDGIFKLLGFHCSHPNPSLHPDVSLDEKTQPLTFCLFLPDFHYPQEGYSSCRSGKVTSYQKLDLANLTTPLHH